MTNSKDNTDPNQSETPVERFWAGTQGPPRGPPAGTNCRGISGATLAPGRSREREMPLGPPLACQPFPYFSCANPNHNSLKHLFKKLMGVTLGGNSVNRH